MRLTPLDRKLSRDLWRLKLQALAVALVLGCGIAIFVMATGMYDSLERARDTYYTRHRMADLEAALVRAPRAVGADLATIPGIAALELRATGLGLASFTGSLEPLSVRIVSLPRDRAPRVDGLVLLRGRWPATDGRDEALINEAFADANDLIPGKPLTVVVKGRRRTLQIVGIASSPEFVFAIAPGELLPEPERFGVLWMPNAEASSWLNLDGAFNDVVVTLAPGTNVEQVRTLLDRRLERHGGRGTIGRDRMLSARYLNDELGQLRTLARILPPVFLSVAVFLLNVTLTRLVVTERANIGLFKAFGYADRTIGWHYAKFALALCTLGAILGSVLGRLAGDYVAGVYRAVYRLPVLEYSAGAEVYGGAFAVSIVAASLGASSAVRNAVRIAPAIALAPPAPTTFGQLAASIERFGRALDPRARMVIRRIVRYPRRATTSILGLGFALALLVMSGHFSAAAQDLIETNFGVAQRMDVTLTFAARQQPHVLHELARLPGVLTVEPRTSPEVILESTRHARRDVVFGIEPDAQLDRIIDSDRRVVAPRTDGLILASGLAAKLEVGVGDRVRLRATDGRRTNAEIPVTQVVRSFVGAAAYFDRERLVDTLREDRIDGALLRIDPAHRRDLALRLKEIPTIAGIAFADRTERSLRKLFDQGAGFFSSVFLTFSIVMAGGVAYSAARVTFAEQQRDLATLRVLGFARAHVSGVLLGEVGALLFVALPVGLCLGALLSQWMMSRFETELFSFPYLFDSRAYGRAAAVVIAAAAVALAWVRRDVDRLDLVAVLKSRE